MFDADFRRQCEALQALARRSWGRRFLGRAVDQGAAAGTEVTGYNDYTSGDDFRHVESYHCARHDELLSKQFRGREEQYVYLLVDCSRGMNVQGGGKFDLAVRLAAGLGYLALCGGDAVGLAASEVGSIAMPQLFRGRPQIPSLLGRMAQLTPEAQTAGLRAAAENLLRTRRKRGSTVILSDLYDPQGYAGAVDLLRRNGYTPHLVQIYAPSEADPNWLGAVRLDDVSTGRAHRQRLDDEDLANYRQVFREFLAEVRGYCHRHSLGLLQVSSDTPFDECLRRMMRVAAARTARGELASPRS